MSKLKKEKKANTTQKPGNLNFKLFDQLPTELTTHIFSFFNRSTFLTAALVNKRFNKIYKDPVIRKARYERAANFYQRKRRSPPWHYQQGFDCDEFEKLYHQHPGDIMTDYLKSDNYKLFPLYFAICWHDLETTKLLLGENNAHINGTKNGYTPLSIAIANGNLDIVKFLVSRGAKLTSTYEDIYSANYLHLAAKSGNKELLQYVLAQIKKQEGDQAILKMIKQRDFFYNMPLHYAAATSLDIVCHLMKEYKLDPHDNGPGYCAQLNTPYDIAIEMFEKNEVDKALRNNKTEQTEETTNPTFKFK